MWLRLRHLHQGTHIGRTGHIMKKYVLAAAAFGAFIAPAMGADMPIKAPPYTPTPWTGWYAGLNAGYASSSARLVASPAARFPTRLMPAGFTKKQTVERRKKFSRHRRTAAQRTRRAKNRAAKIAMAQQAANLTCRKSAILAVLSHKWTTLRELMPVLIGSPPFLTPDGQVLTGNSLRKAIARELEKSGLNSMIEMTEAIQKNGLPEKRFRRRPPGSG
jgi:hypothetical protein